MSTANLTAIVLLAAVATMSVAGQRARGGNVKKDPPAAVSERVSPASTPTPAKRNTRPESGGDAKTETRPVRVSEPGYRYEFSQPEFAVPKIVIEHDDRGVGTISFTKRGEEELITDPVTVSPKALAKINDALAALNFLASDENYQYEKDYSHLGNIKFALAKDGRRREAAYNYTTNKDAKVLMDEYRKIANQYIWVFDIKLSRENQPLESPRLMDQLDSLIRRNEISDTDQLEPFLRELSNDESIPLIARNHAGRLVQQFEKERAKEAKKKAGS